MKFIKENRQANMRFMSLISFDLHYSFCEDHNFFRIITGMHSTVIGREVVLK